MSADCRARWLASHQTRAMALVLLCGALGCGSAGGPDPLSPPPPPPVPPGATAQISMVSNGDGYGGTVPAFEPGTVTIAVGGTVTWSNLTGLGHSVTFDLLPGAPAEIPVPATGSNARTFPTAGEYPFHCAVHPIMTGRVVVQ